MLDTQVLAEHAPTPSHWRTATWQHLAAGTKHTRPPVSGMG